MRDWFPLVVAVAIGLAISLVDSRPTWDDTGITAGALLGAGGLLGLLAPRRPWVMGLAVGIWIPVRAVIHSGSPGALMMFVIVGIPLLGAYAGMALRRLAGGTR